MKVIALNSSSSRGATLRPYQERSINELAAATAKFHSNCYVLPTGGGKTTVAAYVMRRVQARNKRLWFIAHRTELTEQTVARFTQFGADVAVIDPKHAFEPHKQIQVGMVQTLARRLRKIAPGQEPDYIIIDECHRAKAGQYKAIRAACPKAKVIGLTATPYRTDGSGLRDVFDNLVVGALPIELINEGYLTRCRYYVAERDLKDIKTSKGDYDEGQLFDRYNQRDLYKGTVDNWRKYGQGLPTVVFCINVKHSQATADEFNRAGIAAVHLDGETPKEERAQALADFVAGRYQVVCNVGLFTEGTDIPSIGCVIMNRATQSRALWMQCVGRGVRPVYACGYEKPTAAERIGEIAAGAKPFCIVIDQGQNFLAHGAYEAEKPPTLDAKKKRKGGKKEPRPTHRPCPQCDVQLLIQARNCEACGYTFLTRQERAKSDEFVEVTADNIKAAKGKQAKPKPKRPPLPKHLRGIDLLDMTREQLVEVQKHWGESTRFLYGILARQRQRTERLQAEQQRAADLEAVVTYSGQLREQLDHTADPVECAELEAEIFSLESRARQLFYAA